MRVKRKKKKTLAALWKWIVDEKNYETKNTKFVQILVEIIISASPRTVLQKKCTLGFDNFTPRRHCHYISQPTRLFFASTECDIINNDKDESSLISRRKPSVYGIFRSNRDLISNNAVILSLLSPHKTSSSGLTSAE